MMRGLQWMNLPTHWDDDMNLAEEALSKLATHEAQCEERLKRLNEKIDDTRRTLTKYAKTLKVSVTQYWLFTLSYWAQ